MSQILHLTCSPRGEASESTRLSQKIVTRLLRDDPAATLIERRLAEGAIPQIDKDFAMSQALAEDVSQDGSMTHSEELVRELESSDVVVIGTPMHNFTTPVVLKSWIDHVVRARRAFDVTSAGKVGRLRDRPVYIAIASGGRFSGDGARQPDFLTPYLRAVLGIAGLHDLTFFLVQGTSSSTERVAAERTRVDQQLEAHFASRRT